MFSTKIRTSAAAAAITLALGGGLLAGCTSPGYQASAAPQNAAQAQQEQTAHAHSVTEQSRESALYGTMRELWADHMQWTYATVKDFFHNSDALPATLDRLLQNQKDIGDAVASFYGREAGDELTRLLTEHIELAVPVLTAAKEGDDKALGSALDDWYVNAEQIADFLNAANPDAWPKDGTREMMKGHIDTTVTYSVDLLKGDFAKSVANYDEAFHHMMGMSDAIAAGIISQFPDKF